MSEVQKIKEKYAKDLLSIKGITGVGVNGSILVYVEKLTPQVAAFIPRTLEGVPVRIIETGKVKLLSFPIVAATYGERVERVRPPIGGISCGHPEATAGTLTSRVRDKVTKKLKGSSCNHVIALDWGDARIGKKGDAVLQPGVYDGGTEPADKIGELDKWIRVELGRENLIDCALFSCSDIGGIDEVGMPSNVVSPKVGMNVKKSGRTTGLTYSKVIDVNASMKVEGWGEALFTDQIVVKPSFSAPGDSGSWVGDDNDRSVGIVFAGSPEITIVNKAANIESLLGVEFAPSLGYIPFWQALIPIPATVIGIGLTKLGGKKVGS